MKPHAMMFAVLLAAGPLVAQQPGVPPRVPPTAPAARPAETRPAGSVLRCKDGIWAPAGAADAWCATHRGIGFRLRTPVPVPAPLPRPERADSAPRPSLPVTSGGLQAEGAAVSTARASLPAPSRPPAPPADATLLCMDGTYLSGTPDATRCSAHGGLAAILAQRPKRP